MHISGHLQLLFLPPVLLADQPWLSRLLADGVRAAPSAGFAAALTASAWSESTGQSLVLGLLLLPGYLRLPHLGEWLSGSGGWRG